MKGMLAAVLLLALSCAASAADTLELKGYEIGMPRSAIHDAEPVPFGSSDPIGSRSSDCLAADVEKCSNMGKFKCRKKTDRTESCLGLGRISFGGYYGDAFVSLLDGKVVAVTILNLSTEGFDARKAALITKFGKPTSDVATPVQNRMGASFEDEAVTWKRDGQTLVLNKFTDTVTAGDVTLSSDEGFAEFLSLREQSKAAQDAADM